MNQGKTIFAQVMQSIHRQEFQRCVSRYGGDYRVRSFSCRDQFLAMCFAQLTFRESLRDIQACLDSLFAALASTPYEHEIFIVDNGSIDTTPDIIQGYAARYPATIYPIFLTRNHGTTYSRNLALKRVRGKYIAIMDSDVEIPSGTLETLIYTLEQNKQSGLAAPKILYPNGKLQKSIDQFPTVLTKIHRLFFLKTIEKYCLNYP